MRACYAIPGQCWPVEQGWLYDMLSFSKRHVEIGAFCGKSLLASCGGMCDAEVIAVDPLTETPAGRPWHKAVLNASIELINSTFREKRVIAAHIEKTSVDAALIVGRNKKVDSVFIDGDHHYAEVAADIATWLPLINPGGIICGHDYWARNAEVMDAVNNTLADFQVASNTRIWWKRVE